MAAAAIRDGSDTAVNRYRFFGTALLTDLELPELEPVADELAIGLRLQQLPYPPAVPTGREVEGYGERETEVSVVASPSEMVVEVPDFGVLAVNDQIGTVRYWSAVPVDALWRHQLLDLVLPRLFARRHRAVLHASAVVVDGSAIVCCGPSGSGKSTLATRLGRLGYPVLADDAVAVDVGAEPTATGSYRGLRLWPDSVELVGVVPGSAMGGPASKRRVRPRGVQFAETPWPLGAVIDLYRDRPGAASALNILRGGKALDVVLRAMFAPYRLRPDEDFAVAADVAAAAPVARLDLGGDLGQTVGLLHDIVDWARR